MWKGLEVRGGRMTQKVTERKPAWSAWGEDPLGEPERKGSRLIMQGLIG